MTTEMCNLTEIYPIVISTPQIPQRAYGYPRWAPTLYKPVQRKDGVWTYRATKTMGFRSTYAAAMRDAEEWADEIGAHVSDYVRHGTPCDGAI